MNTDRLSCRLQHWQAVAWLTLGQPKRALSQWTRLIESHGPRTVWVSSRAHVLSQQGDNTAALEDYDWLCQQASCQAADWFNRGFLLEQMGQPEQAVDCFEQAVQKNPDLDRAWFGLGLCRMRLGQLDLAMLAFKRNTQLQPMSPYGWIELARVHAQRQEPEQMLSIIRHLQGFEPKIAAELMREMGLNQSSGQV